MEREGRGPEDPPRESLGRVGMGSHLAGAAGGLVVEVEGRKPHPTNGVPVAGRGRARALRAASCWIISALFLEDWLASRSFSLKSKRVKIGNLLSMPLSTRKNVGLRWLR